MRGETEQEYFEAARIHYHLTTAEVIVADNTMPRLPRPDRVANAASAQKLSTTAL